MNIYFVRIGRERGRGAYVHPMSYLDLDGRIIDVRLTYEQRLARRFYRSDLAKLYADAFGGRVVRLRERSGR